MGTDLPSVDRENHNDWALWKMCLCNDRNKISNSEISDESSDDSNNSNDISDRNIDESNDKIVTVP